VNLFARLVDRVFHFLNLYFADYIEAVVGCHFFTSKKECRRRIARIKSGSKADQKREHGLYLL
jgi:hypothetical protein